MDLFFFGFTTFRRPLTNNVLTMQKILLLLISLITLSCMNNSNKESNDPEVEKMKSLIEDFQNRPIYKELTSDILQSVNDDDLEQVIFDNIYEQLGDDYAKEYQNLQKCSKGQQAFFVTWIVEGEVNNGGFNQFYFNSSGQYAEMAVEGFALFGATKYVDLMKRANKIYSENEERLKSYDDGTIESFSESYKDNPLNALDDEFYELTEPLPDLRIKYIRENISEFIQE